MDDHHLYQRVDDTFQEIHDTFQEIQKKNEKFG
jgi:hypothetical protein